MAILLATPGRDTQALTASLTQLEPDLDLRIWPRIGDAASVEFVVCWQHPPGLFKELTGLKAACSLGAGVDQLLADPDLPASLPLGRLSGQRLAADMAAYLVGQVTRDWRRLGRFDDLQSVRHWEPFAPDHPPMIGLLGYGSMARKSAMAFAALDFPIMACRRQAVHSEHYPVRLVDLETLAGESDYLICTLPLTTDTRGILDAGLFACMKSGSVLINVGRGEHLNENDLLKALEIGQPARAILDVFRSEPLPLDHPFWKHPAIHLTPHCASLTQPEEAAALILESYHRIRAGLSPLGVVDRQAGY